MSATQISSQQRGFEVRFESLFRSGCGLSFPCDERGQVDIDALGEKGRNDYFLARAMQGRDYATPRVVPCGRSPVR